MAEISEDAIILDMQECFLLFKPELAKYFSF
jgi:hypothetical protein